MTLEEIIRELAEIRHELDQRLGLLMQALQAGEPPQQRRRRRRKVSDSK